MPSRAQRWVLEEGALEGTLVVFSSGCQGKEQGRDTCYCQKTGYLLLPPRPACFCLPYLPATAHYRCLPDLPATACCILPASACLLLLPATGTATRG